MHFHIAGGHDKGVFAIGGYCYSHLGCAIHYNQLVELITLVGRNGQRYRLAHVCRCFVGSYGAVLGRRDGDGVVCHLEGGRDFHIAGGHDKGVFAIFCRCYRHLVCAIHHMDFVQLVALVRYDGQGYGLAVVCRLFVGSHISAHGSHNDDIVVYRLEGSGYVHIASGHGESVVALGGYCYSHLGCAIQHMELVQLVALVGCNGQRYGLAHVCRLFVRSYGAALGRLNGDSVVNHLEVGYDCCITCAHDECITLG